MYDSVYVFAQGLAALDRGHILKPANLSCELEQPWNDGLSLYNYINSVSNIYTWYKPDVHQRVGVNTVSNFEDIGFEFQPGPAFWTETICRFKFQQPRNANAHHRGEKNPLEQQTSALVAND